MRTAVFNQPVRALKIELVDEPKAGADQVAIAVKHCGICGRDLQATEERDNLLVAGTMMGHEFSGEVVEVASGCPSDWQPRHRPALALKLRKELPAIFVAADNKVDLEMVAGLMATDKIAVTNMCAATVGFADFHDAFKSLLTLNPNCTIMPDPSVG